MALDGGGASAAEITPRLRGLKWAYFGYFAWLGAAGPYWTIYLTQGLGFSETLAGILFALHICGMVAGSFWWNAVADALRVRRALQRGMSLLTLVTSLLWLLVEAPHVALLMALVHGFGCGAHSSMLDATLIDALGSRRARFGKVRAIGTLGWGVSAFVLGHLRSGQPQRIVFAMVGCMAFFHLTTWWIPDSQVTTRERRPRLRLKSLPKSRALCVCLAAIWIHALSLGGYESFAAIHWGKNGVSDGGIATIYAVGILSEMTMFVLMPALLGRWSAVSLMGFSSGITAVRWLATSGASSTEGFLLLQTLHGFSFGLFYAAALHIVSSLVSPVLRTSGQALLMIAFSSGFGTGGGLAGFCRSTLGGSVTFAFAALFAGAALILLRTQRHHFQDAPVLVPE